MDHLQSLLSHIVDLGAPMNSDELGDWYPVIPNDPEEWNQPKSPVGLMVQISGEPGRYRINGFSSYNR